MNGPDRLATLGRVTRLRRDAAERRWREAAGERRSADERHQTAVTERDRAEEDAQVARAAAMQHPADPAGWAWRTVQQARQREASAAQEQAAAQSAQADQQAELAARRHAVAEARATGLDDRIARARAASDRRRDERASGGDA